MVVGLISDTHGLVRPDVAIALADVELILHAGDVGGAAVLSELGRIAPVRAVRGNTDSTDDGRLSACIECEIGGLTVHVSHGHELGSPTPQRLLARYTADVIVYGHTHQALIQRAGVRLAVNPGAAGPRRFRVRPTVARLAIVNGHAEAELVPLGG